MTPDGADYRPLPCELPATALNRRSVKSSDFRQETITFRAMSKIGKGGRPPTPALWPEPAMTEMGSARVKTA